MADELDELVAHDLAVLDEVVAPDLWDRIVALADTERVAARRARRRWPLLAAAAAVLVVAAVGLVLWTRDDATPADEPPSPPPAGADNTVRVTLDDDAVELDAAPSAGWLSLLVDNRTDDIRTFSIHALLPGQRFGDAVAALATAADGDEQALTGIVADEPVLGALVTTSGATHTVGVPIAAGDYLVVASELDGAMRYVPRSGRVVPLHVSLGDAGEAPTTDVPYQIIGATPIGPTSTPAGRTTFSFDAGDDPAHEWLLADLRDGAKQVDWDNWSPWNYPPSPADFTAAPVDSMIALWGTAPDRTVTLDLDLGPVVVMGGDTLDAMSFMAIAFIQVD